MRIVRRSAVMPASAFPTTLHPVLRRVYSTRSVRSVDELELGLERLIPVRMLGNVEAAVELLLHHRRRQTRVLVIGDFDADGATSTALVVRQLRRLGFAEVEFLVPNRFEYGYGLTTEIVTVALARRPGLIITVDNGISSHDGVALARSNGVQVLVTDHHLPGEELPQADVIVNPNLTGETFPSKALAGVGVAFYVLAALTRVMSELALVNPETARVADLLDLVALGTVADLVPLDQNNRILVHQGLKRMRAGRCVPGIRALLEASGRRLDTLVAQDLGFHAGPRLNAAGRLDDMTLGIRCLLTDDLVEARMLAARLAQLNDDRKMLEARMQQEALAQIDAVIAADDLPLGLSLYRDDWHQGVVGLVASRVKERTHRPVVAFARTQDGELKGSARSVPGVNIRDVLAAVATRHPGLISRFGGHAMAAGLSLHLGQLAAFQQAFNEEVARSLTLADVQGVIYSDGALLADELSLEVAQAVRGAGPWGQAFPEPVFDGEFAVVDARTVGDRHLKLRVRPLLAGDSGPACDAIAFRHFDQATAAVVDAHSQVTLAYRVDVNEYGGTQRLQLLVEHLAGE